MPSIPNPEFCHHKMWYLLEHTAQGQAASVGAESPRGVRTRRAAPRRRYDTPPRDLDVRSLPVKEAAVRLMLRVAAIPLSPYLGEFKVYLLYYKHFIPIFTSIFHFICENKHKNKELAGRHLHHLAISYNFP